MAADPASIAALREIVPTVASPALSDLPSQPHIASPNSNWTQTNCGEKTAAAVILARHIGCRGEYRARGDRGVGYVGIS
jgi:hypothetical protein